MLVTSELPIILLSIKVACLATLLILPIGICLGWILARKEFRGKTLLDALVNLPLILPPVVTGYFLLFLLGPKGWIGEPLKTIFGIEFAFNWLGAVIAAGVVALPLLVRAVVVSVKSVDPKSVSYTHLTLPTKA